MPLEDGLIYFPDNDRSLGPSLTGRVVPAGQWLMAAEDHWLTAADGTKLHSWFAKPIIRPENPVPPPQPEVVILYFHGNAGNVAQRHDILVRFVETGFSILALDYRGYGRSEGVPSEKGIYQDAEAAWNHLVVNLKFPPERIILFGKSLGGGAAVELATRVKPGGLFLQSTFTSIPEMAGELLPFVPKFLISTKMDNLKKMPSVTCPKLIIHSRRDEIVPFRMGEKLFEAATEPKFFLRIPNTTHNETVFAPGTGYEQVVREFGDLVRRR